jgi:hypothetical protein
VRANGGDDISGENNICWFGEEAFAVEDMGVSKNGGGNSHRDLSLNADRTSLRAQSLSNAEAK